MKLIDASLALVFILLFCAGAYAQYKPMTEAEKDKLKTFSSLEKAKTNPDEVQAFCPMYAKLTEVPPEVKLFKNMVMLDLGCNSIKEIPTFIFDLPNLKEFGFSHNQVSVIPKEIGKLKNLVGFKAWDNKITSVPDELLSLPHLQVLELKGNPIPKEEKERIKKKYPNLKVLF